MEEVTVGVGDRVGSVGRGVEGGFPPGHDDRGAGNRREVPARGVRLSWGQVAGGRASQPWDTRVKIIQAEQIILLADQYE